MLGVIFIQNKTLYDPFFLKKQVVTVSSRIELRLNNEVKTIFFANTAWYLYNFRLNLARFLRDQGVEVVMMSPPDDHAKRFLENGFRWISLPMNRSSLNVLRELHLLGFIRAAFKQEAPDVVHAFTLKCVIYGGLAAQAAGVSRRIHAVTGLGHVFINQSIKARNLRRIVQCLLKLALRGSGSRLIVQNPDDQQMFLDKGLITRERVCLIKGSGVDTIFFEPVQRKECNETCSKVKVLLAARLLQEKGIDEYAKAASMLTHRADAIEFLLAGATDSGNPSSISETELHQWHSSGRLKVLGHVNDIRQLMSNIDMVVLPSWREGLPKGLLEAASMGLPIIATDVPGCKEIVQDGVNGFLVPAGNAAALAEKIEKLLDDPSLRAQFGRAGREKAVREFDQQIVFQQTWKVYLSLGTA